MDKKNIFIGIGLFIGAVIAHYLFDIEYKVISFALFGIASVTLAIMAYLHFAKLKELYYREPEKEELKEDLTKVDSKEDENSVAESIEVITKSTPKSKEIPKTKFDKFKKLIQDDPTKMLIYPGFAAFFVAKAGSIVGVGGIPFLDLGEGFSGTAHLFNALVTYFPIFMFLFNSKKIKSIFNKNEK